MKMSAAARFLHRSASVDHRIPFIYGLVGRRLDGEVGRTDHEFFFGLAVELPPFLLSPLLEGLPFAPHGLRPW